MYYVVDKEEHSGFPSTSSYKLGWFAGFEENIGNIMCCKIFTANTQKMIPRSRVISAAKDFSLGPPDSQEHDIKIGEQHVPHIKSFSEVQKQKLMDFFGMKDLEDIHPSDLVGRSYLQPEHNSDGIRYMYKVPQPLKEHEEKLGKDKTRQ